jgi:tRNA threonylcarbamoyladenosine biosynthesis protein TsaB
MLILALNTAFAAMDGAIMRDGVCLAEVSTPLARGQEQALPGFVDDLLTQASITLADLDRLAVVTGPGSFTGIRIGVSYMRGLALALDLPCVGLSSLEAGAPIAATGAVLCGLQAQRRPPEQTWWVQTLQDGYGTAPTAEIDQMDFVKACESFQGDVLLSAPDAMAGDRVFQQLDIRARHLALKAAGVTPDDYPPSPVYARAPDAALPAGGK